MSMRGLLLRTTSYLALLTPARSLFSSASCLHTAAGPLPSIRPSLGIAKLLASQQQRKSYRLDSHQAAAASSSAMDCLSCADPPAPPLPSDKEFLGSICQLAGRDLEACPYPAVAGRYTLYVLAGCPFAARPWVVLNFYGLNEGAVRVVKCFPAAAEDGWFFRPESEGEKALQIAYPEATVDEEPHHGYHHLSQLYYHANKNFVGAVSVPLLWDGEKDTAVSNSSLELAEMLATNMRTIGTRNSDVLLFPARGTPDYEAHDALVKRIHSFITTPPYKINASADGKEHDSLVKDYYGVLDEFEQTLGSRPFLVGDQVHFADLLLFISLIRLDLAYQWRFRLGFKSVRDDYPKLWGLVQRILAIDGIAETVLPRDIMALYFMTPKFAAQAGKTLPLVPDKWMKSFEAVSSSAHS